MVAPETDRAGARDPRPADRGAWWLPFLMLVPGVVVLLGEWLRLPGLVGGAVLLGGLVCGLVTFVWTVSRPTRLPWIVMLLRAAFVGAVAAVATATIAMIGCSATGDPARALHF